MWREEFVSKGPLISIMYVLATGMLTLLMWAAVMRG
jgi:hypothetical protein